MEDDLKKEIINGRRPTKKWKTTPTKNGRWPQQKMKDYLNKNKNGRQPKSQLK